MLSKGFLPVANQDCKILILGSMPSVKSLQNQQYYGHPRNAFWKIMAIITGVPFEASYQKRCIGLNNNGITLWDVIGKCERSGSLDANIIKESVIPNDILTFINNHNYLAIIALNGGAAYKCFKKYFISQIPKHIEIVQLPSTSPAYTLPLEKKMEMWLKRLSSI